MWLRFRSLVVVVVLVVVSPLLSCFGAESGLGNAPALDALLQDYAYRAFFNPRTGVVFDGAVPLNLTGIKVSGLRLRSGSLFKRGVRSYKEFEISKGVVVQSYVERLVLVYQKLGSSFTPVLGLLAYDAKNLSATNLPGLDITASESPINIHFSNVKAVLDGSTARCVWFNLIFQGTVNFSNVVSKNTFSTTQQGHFALVVEGIAPSPAPEGPSPETHKKKKKDMKRVWIIVGSIVGGVLKLVLLGMFFTWLRKYQQRKKMAYMEVFILKV
ncbi:hypothetical protein RND81_07G063100 [Saponaria officinalis]|uniref:Uncharacterized protein n=1 Tax=Saponaria officinalis TaxID=3572 RepID=A0AAW1JNU3_SAPOF